MNLVKNLKIRDKLLILLFILLIPLLFFSILKIRTEVASNAELKRVLTGLSESEKISMVLHAFQKERARILAASKGDSAFLTEARTLRPVTDETEKRLLSYLAETGRSFPQVSLLNDLRKYRNDLDQGELNTTEFRSYSNNLIFTFLGRIEENASGINNAEIRRELLSFVKLADAKLQLGRIRSLLMRVIQEGSFSKEDFGLFKSQKDFYSDALTDFRRYATPDAKADLDRRTHSANFLYITRIIETLEANPDQNLKLYNANKVFWNFTEGVEDLKRSEDILISKIQSFVSEESANKEKGLLALSAVILTSLALATLLSFYIITLISSSLSTLKNVADKVTLGATDVVIPIYSRDEIGRLADSFRGLVRKNQSLSEVAKAIGEGNYEVNVEASSEADILSNAIREMKDNLARFTRENERRNWILTGLSELNNQISVATGLNILTEKALSFLCSYTGSEAGVIYLCQDTHLLVPTSAYGTSAGIDEIPSFRSGTGKIGQALAEHRICTIEDVPGEYMKITTGLTEIKPSDLIIIPLHFSGQLAGVIELSARKKYNKRDIDFFEAVSERIAIAILTLKSHIQTQDLLYHTQNQAEELETQQEELKQLNAELKASEEELKVNQEELQEKKLRAGRKSAAAGRTVR